jgi:hypothetical protein
MTEQEPLKIIIPVEEEPPMKSEHLQTGAGEVTKNAGRKAAVAAKAAAEKAWQSETGRKAAKKLQETGDRGIRYVGTRMADTAEQQAKQTAASVQQRIKETDIQQEAKVGLVSGLRWLSAQLSELASRVGPGEPHEKSPTDNNQPGS